ncbi:hypothetical protein VTP01DRAFT_1024 [Rhizomucor pusillus]|uniref:uncharacterized protein n=1 Tax=Rhizomucor pusillus TaxID=4840 RepID=UPI0037438A31
MEKILNQDLDKDEYYRILNCFSSSNQNQIRAEYKRLALQYHPDKNKGHTEQYQKIKEAYDVLGDPERRAVYDRWRQSGLAVPFADYLQTASLSQTIHWHVPPKMPLGLTESGETSSKPTYTSSSAAPYTREKPSRPTSFWAFNKSDDLYARFREYQL